MAPTPPKTFLRPKGSRYDYPVLSSSSDPDNSPTTERTRSKKANVLHEGMDSFVPPVSIARPSVNEVWHFRHNEYQKARDNIAQFQPIVLSTRHNHPEYAARYEGNLPDAIARFRTAAGTSVVARDLKEMMELMIRKIDQKTGIYADSRTPNLSSPDKNLVRNHIMNACELLSGYQEAKSYIESMEIFVLKIKNQIANKNDKFDLDEFVRERKGFLEPTIKTVSLWVIDQLYRHQQVLIPCDFDTLDGTMRHSSSLYIKSLPDGGFSVQKFDALFPFEKAIHEDKVKSRQKTKSKSSIFRRYINTEARLSPGDFKPQHFCPPDTPKSLIFSCREARGGIQSVNQRENENISSDENTISNLLAVHVFNACHNSTSVQVHLERIMSLYGKVFTPPQVMVNVQNPIECQYYSLMTAVRNIIHDPISYWCLQESITQDATLMAKNYEWANTYYAKKEGKKTVKCLVTPELRDLHLTHLRQEYTKKIDNHIRSS